MKPLCSAKSYNPFHRADVIEAPSAALKGQDDNSPGQARHERRPGNAATKTHLPFSWFAPKVFGAIQEKGRFSFLVSLPRAALRLPGAIIISSLQDFSLARPARKLANNQVSDRSQPPLMFDLSLRKRVSPIKMTF